MPFDGIVVKCMVKELNETLVGSRIEKIFQPEPDEVIMNIRAKSQNMKLLLSASASYPRIHFTEVSKENPSTPPVFCMLLRKYLSGGRITDVYFHDFERIITLQVESTNELGDLTVKKLIIEIMGKHSNIILVNSEDKILDAIKHIDNEVSSVREVMPARMYMLPPSQNKQSPENLEIGRFINDFKNTEDIGIEKYILNNIKGFSPLLCREVTFRAGIDGKASAWEISGGKMDELATVLNVILQSINNSDFTPCLISDAADGRLIDFHCLQIRQYTGIRHIPSMSSVLDTFYCEKDRFERLKQKKSDILKVLSNGLDRCNKKLALQQDKLREVSDREKLKLYGELITANIYCMPKGIKTVSLLNYYDENNESLDIPLDEHLTPQENAQRYFKKYSKAKSAFASTSKQLEETQRELEYLESVLHLLENCTSLQEIEEVRQELVEQGYIISRKKSKSKKPDKATLPLHYKSSEGFDIFVGKNNKQNDLLTLKLSSSNDMWLHTRNIPGSHVIIRKLNMNIPDHTLFEAANIAAYHSKAKMSSHVPVDYTQVKNVKKPNGVKPGMVIYDNFRTITVTPDEEMVKSLKIDK